MIDDRQTDRQTDGHRTAHSVNPSALLTFDHSATKNCYHSNKPLQSLKV